MSKFKVTSVTLSEVLEVRSGPLLESEIWSILAKTIFVIQDDCLRGEFCKRQNQFITPDSLEFHSNGAVTLCLNATGENPLCLQVGSDHEKASSICEIHFEKRCVEYLGKTLTCAMDFPINHTNQSKQIFSSELLVVVKSMQKSESEDQVSLFSLYELVNRVAKSKTNGKPFSYYIINMYTEVLGSLSEIAKLMQIDCYSVTPIERNDCNIVEGPKVEVDADYKSLPAIGIGRESPSLNSNALYEAPGHHNASETFKFPPEISKSFDDLHPDAINELVSGTSGHISVKSSVECITYTGGKEMQERRISGENEMSKPEFHSDNAECNQAVSTTTVMAKDSLTTLEFRDIHQHGENFGNKEQIPEIFSRIPDITCDYAKKPVSFGLESQYQSRGYDEANKSCTKNCTGPEFVNRSYLPNIRLQMKNKKCPSSSSKTITVICMTGQRFLIECDLETTSANDILSLVIEHQNLREIFLFGLACIKDDEFLFLEHYDKLSKMLSTRVQHQKNGGLVIDTLTLYFRVKFYVNTIFLRHSTTKDMFYLQLRKDVLENRISCNLSASLLLASFAMQAEYGQDDSANEATLEYYFPLSVLEKNDVQSIKTRLKQLHESHKGMSVESAKGHFLNKVQTLQDYGFHFHTIFRYTGISRFNVTFGSKGVTLIKECLLSGNKKDSNSSISLGMSLHGISLFDKRMMEDGCKLELQRFLWVNILRIWSDRRHFYFSLRHRNLKSHLQKYRFSTADNLGQYLFNLATSHHRLQLRLVMQSEENFAITPEREYNNNEKDYDIGLETSSVEKSIRNRRERNQISPKTSKRKLFRASFSPNQLCDQNRSLKHKRSAFKSKLLKAVLRKQSENQSSGETKDDLDFFISRTPISSPNRNSVFKDTGLQCAFSPSFGRPEETINTSLAEKFTNLTGIEKSTERKITGVYLDRDSHKNSLGIKVCEGTDGSTYIQHIDSQNTSLNIMTGDRIVAINGKYIENLGYPEVVELIRNTTGRVQLFLSRAISQEPQSGLDMYTTSPPESISIKNYSVISLSNSAPCSYMKNNEELILSDEAMWDASVEKTNEKYDRKRFQVRNPGEYLKTDDIENETASELKYDSSNVTSIEDDQSEVRTISTNVKGIAQLALPAEDCKNSEEFFGDGHPLTIISKETNPSGKPPIFAANSSPIIPVSEHETTETMKPHEFWHIFHVVLEKVDADLGIKLMSRHGCAPEGPVVIESLTKEGAAHMDGRIRAGDTIVEIGGVNVCGLPHCEVIGLLRGGPQVIHLAVQRNSPAPQRSAFWNQVEGAPPVPPRPSSTHRDSSLDGKETDFACCHLSVSTLNRFHSDPDSDEMVSKLNKSSEDVSGQPLSPDSVDESSPDTPTKTVLWQPKISGSVKSRISNIEAHHQPAAPSWIPRQPLQQSPLQKKLVSQSNLDLSCQYSSNAPKLKFTNKFPSLQENVIHFGNAEAQAVPPQLMPDGKWCPAVVSKPYRPGAAPCLPKLMRSKTLPAVYVPPPKTAPKSDSTEEVSNYGPESPPPWLAHLKNKGLQQRPPWWSRTNSVDATGGAGFPAPKMAMTSPTSTKRVPSTPPLSRMPFSSPMFPSAAMPKKMVSPVKPAELPKSPKAFKKAPPFPIANFDTTDGQSAKPVPQMNGILKPVKAPSSPGHQTTKTMNSASSNVLPTSACVKRPLRRDAKLEELHKQFNFINEDTIFDVPLTKNTRGLGIRICGGRDQDPDDRYTVFIRIKRLYPLQPAIECRKLEVGDIILTVNGRHLTGLSHSEAVDVLRVSPSSLVLLICRPLPNVLPPVPLDDNHGSSGLIHKPSALNFLSLKNDVDQRQQPAAKDFNRFLVKVNGSLGFTLHRKDEYHHKHGHFIKALVKDPALSDGRLQPGDQILKVNGVDISNMSHTEAISVLRTCSNTVNLTIRRTNDKVSSPLSPISPVVAFFPQDDSNKIRQEKKILRKEALDLLSDNSRRKNGELGPTSFESSKSLHRRRKLNGSPSNLSADSATSDTAENFSSDADSRRSSPTPTIGLPKNGDFVKPESFKALQPSVARDSPHSSLSNGGSIPLFKVPRPSFLSLTKQTNFFENSICTVSPSESLSDSGRGHVPALCVSKYESDGTTPSTEDTDSDSSGAIVPPRLDSVQKINAPVLHNGSPAKFNGSDIQAPENPKCFQKLQFLATAEDANTGLRKWRGTVLSPVNTPKEELPVIPPAAEQFQQDMFTVELDRIWNSRLGFSLVAVEIGKLKGSFIRAIHPGSLASNDGRLRPGDKILKINGISIENTQTDDVIEMLRKLNGKILLEVARNPVVTNSVLNILRFQSI